MVLSPLDATSELRSSSIFLSCTTAWAFILKLYDTTSEGAWGILGQKGRETNWERSPQGAAPNKGDAVVWEMMLERVVSLTTCVTHTTRAEITTAMLQVWLFKDTQVGPKEGLGCLKLASFAQLLLLAQEKTLTLPYKPSSLTSRAFKTENISLKPRKIGSYINRKITHKLIQNMKLWVTMRKPWTVIKVAPPIIFQSKTLITRVAVFNQRNIKFCKG